MDGKYIVAGQRGAASSRTCPASATSTDAGFQPDTDYRVTHRRLARGVRGPQPRGRPARRRRSSRRSTRASRPTPSSSRTRSPRRPRRRSRHAGQRRYPANLTPRRRGARTRTRSCSRSARTSTRARSTESDDPLPAVRDGRPRRRLRPRGRPDAGRPVHVGQRLRDGSRRGGCAATSSLDAGRPPDDGDAAPDLRRVPRQRAARRPGDDAASATSAALPVRRSRSRSRRRTVRTQTGLPAFEFDGDVPITTNLSTAEVNTARAPSRGAGLPALRRRRRQRREPLHPVRSRHSRGPVGLHAHRPRSRRRTTASPTTSTRRSDTVLDTGATRNTCLNATDGSTAVVFEFRSFHDPQGVTVRIIGSNPAIILVQGDVLIEAGGRLLVRGDGNGRPPQSNGGNGTAHPNSTQPRHAAGGTAVAGGGDGGDARTRARRRTVGRLLRRERRRRLRLDRLRPGRGHSAATQPRAGRAAAATARSRRRTCQPRRSSTRRLARRRRRATRRRTRRGHEPRRQRRRTHAAEQRSATGAEGGGVRRPGDQPVVGDHHAARPRPARAAAAAATARARRSRRRRSCAAPGGGGGAGGGFVDITSSPTSASSARSTPRAAAAATAPRASTSGGGGGGGGSGGGIRLLTPGMIVFDSTTVITAGGGAAGAGRPGGSASAGIANAGGMGADGPPRPRDDGLADHRRRPARPRPHARRGQPGLLPLPVPRRALPGRRPPAPGGHRGPRHRTLLARRSSCPDQNYALPPVAAPLIPRLDFVAGIPSIASRGIGKTGIFIEAKGFAANADGSVNTRQRHGLEVRRLLHRLGLRALPQLGRRARSRRPRRRPTLPPGNTGDGIASLNGRQYIQLRITFFLPDSFGPFDPGPYIDSWNLYFQYDQ